MISAVQAEVSNPAIQVIAPVASQTVQLFQSQIENVGSNCKILTNALDDLTKIHPFVAGMYRWLLTRTCSALTACPQLLF